MNMGAPTCLWARGPFDRRVRLRNASMDGGAKRTKPTTATALQDILPPAAPPPPIQGNPQMARAPARNQSKSRRANDPNFGAQRLARLRVGWRAEPWPERAKRTTS